MSLRKGVVVIKYCELDLDSSYCSAPCRTQTNIQIDVTGATRNWFGLPENYGLDSLALLTHSLSLFTIGWGWGVGCLKLLLLNPLRLGACHCRRYFQERMSTVFRWLGILKTPRPAQVPRGTFRLSIVTKISRIFDENDGLTSMSNNFCWIGK